VNIHRMIDEFLRAHRAIDELTKNFAIDRLMRDLARFQSFQDEISRSLDLRSIERIQSQISSAFEAAQVASQHFERAASRIATDAQSLTDALSRFAAPALTSAMLIFDGIAAPATVLIMNSTLSSAIKSLRQATDIWSANQFEDFLGQLEHGVAEAIRGAPDDPKLKFSLYRHLLSVLLFVLGVAHSQALSHCSAQEAADFEARLMHQFRLMNDRFDELDLPKSEAHYEFYLVERWAPLTQKPRSNSTVMKWLQPGELVWVSARKGPWVRIHYVDSGDGTEHGGWTRKKYLTR